jgi:hypothetical protein
VGPCSSMQQERVCSSTADRCTDAWMMQVVRCFEDDDIVHVSGKVRQRGSVCLHCVRLESHCVRALTHTCGVV